MKSDLSIFRHISNLCISRIIIFKSSAFNSLRRVYVLLSVCTNKGEMHPFGDLKLDMERMNFPYPVRWYSYNLRDSYCWILLRSFFLWKVKLSAGRK